jgi:hypothetical protein
MPASFSASSRRPSASLENLPPQVIAIVFSPEPWIS